MSTDSGFVNQAHNILQAERLAMHVGVNWCPLVSRIERAPLESSSFSMGLPRTRPRRYVFASGLTLGSHSATILGSQHLMKGDVLDVGYGEHVEVVDVRPGDTVVIRRGVGGTFHGTMGTHAEATLIGNSRLDDRLEFNQKPAYIEPVEQYCQKWVHHVSVDESDLKEFEICRQKDEKSALDLFKKVGIRNLLEDMETSCYYGIGEKETSDFGGKQKGLRQLIGGRCQESPRNSSWYKGSDFFRDTVLKSLSGKGSPDVILIASNFLEAFEIWGFGVKRINMGASIGGEKISVLDCGLFPGMAVVEAPLLRPFTAICLTSSGVRLRMMTNETFELCNCCDARLDGRWVAAGAIEVDDPLHHSWVEGITRFSKT